MMVTGALSSPKARSGCASGFIRSATGTFAASAWPRERRQRGDTEHGKAKRDSGGAQAKFASGDMQLKLRWLLATPNARWLAGYGNCGNGEPSCQGGRKAQFRLMAAPRRASAWRKSSSSTAGRLAAMRATISGSSGGGRVGGSRRRSGAWRKAMRPIACQPKKRLTRSRITADKCWISSAAGPSTRSTKVAGSATPSSGPRRIGARPGDLHRLAVGGDFRRRRCRPSAR